MSMVDNIDEITQNLNKRKPVFVDENGIIHDAEKMGHIENEDDDVPKTQVKSTIWY